jgi:ATP-binding cassette, subfamily C (CFTR/MRP), member 1
MRCRVSSNSFFIILTFNVLDITESTYSIAPWLNWWTDANQENPNANLGKWMGVYAAFGILSLCFLGLNGA